MHIEAHIDYLEESIELLEEELNGDIENSIEMKEDIANLKTIPGIADKSAARVMSYIGDVNKFDDASQITSFAGLAPRECSSGTSLNRKSRLSKSGTIKLRKCLYMPTVSAIRSNPIIKDFYHRLRSKGKSAKTAICACMRKLLGIIYAILKNKTTFDPNYYETRFGI